jgi:hypothetical protein
MADGKKAIHHSRFVSLVDGVDEIHVRCEDTAL